MFMIIPVYYSHLSGGGIKLGRLIKELGYPYAETLDRLYMAEITESVALEYPDLIHGVWGRSYIESHGTEYIDSGYKYHQKI